MAQAAWHGAHELVITSDNPRHEDPERIIDDIVRGLPDPRHPRVHRQVDRAEAIRDAIHRAGTHDVVLIAGKGHEQEQIVGAERRAFSDQRVAEAALTERARDAAVGASRRGTEGGDVL